MKHKTTHRIRGDNYSIRKGQLRRVGEDGLAADPIGRVILDHLVFEPTDAELKTLESMRRRYGIERPKLIKKMKVAWGGRGVWAYSHLWKYDIDKSKIRSNMHLSKAISTKLKGLVNPANLDKVVEANHDCFTEKFYEAFDGSKSIYELWQNMAVAGNEITVMARKWHRSYMRKQYSIELKKMIQKERRKQRQNNNGLCRT